jgi:hypothetical protein
MSMTASRPVDSPGGDYVERVGHFARLVDEAAAAEVEGLRGFREAQEGRLVEARAYLGLSYNLRAVGGRERSGASV